MILVLVASLALCSVTPVTLNVLSSTVSLKFNNSTPKFRSKVNDSKTTGVSSDIKVVTFNAEPSRRSDLKTFPAKSATAPAPIVT